MIARKSTCQRMVLAATVLWLGWADSVRAGYIYSFTADTSSVSGQLGSLEFQFNGADVGGSDTLQITAFSSVRGILGAGATIGDVTGDLANLPATFTDDTPLNDLSHVFTFGTSLTFTLDLATNSASPGATFAFTMYDNQGMPVNADINGVSAVEIIVDQGGNPESPLLGPGMSGGQQGPSATPAPASAVLLAIGGGCLAAFGRLRHNRRRMR